MKDDISVLKNKKHKNSTDKERVKTLEVVVFVKLFLKRQILNSTTLQVGDYLSKKTRRKPI